MGRPRWPASASAYIDIIHGRPWHIGVDVYDDGQTWRLWRGRRLHVGSVFGSDHACHLGTLIGEGVLYRSMIGWWEGVSLADGAWSHGLCSCWQPSRCLDGVRQVCR